MGSEPPVVGWEGRWAAYDAESYDRAEAWVWPGAAVLDIGAGDLRLARRLARRARVVYAVERRPELLPRDALPGNVRVVCGDARALPFPPGVDVAVLLMRHCAHFALYRRKLERVGCRRLITNARWGMGVECVDLTRPPQPYASLAMGWYACRCGRVGFRAGPPEALTAELMETVAEVDGCPGCQHGWNRNRFP